MIMWVRVSADSKNQSIMIDGVFSSRELGMSGISDTQVVVPFDLDRDYTDHNEFVVFSNAHPDGILTEG